MNIIINDNDPKIKKMVVWRNGNIDFCDIKFRKDKLIFIDDSNLSLFVYILYCLNVNILKFKDQPRNNCKINNTKLNVNDNLIYHLANKKNLYENLGFKRGDLEGFKIIINKYKNLLLEDNGILKGFKLSYIANIYINSAIKYDDVCLSLSLVSSIIEKVMSKEQQMFETSLYKNKLKFYKSKIVFPR